MSRGHALKSFCRARRAPLAAPAKDNRRFVKAVLWIMRTGSQWRDLPEKLGHWHPDLCALLPLAREGCLGAHGERTARRCRLFIDSTIVRGHQLSAGAKKAGGQEIGNSRGELTTKLHVAVDALGNPLRVIPSGGEAADITQGTTLIEGLGTEAVITDKGYDDGKLVIPFRNPVYR